MDYYDDYELKLEEKLKKIKISSKSHEERSALIRMSHVKFKQEKDALKTLFMSNVMKAKHRNSEIRDLFQTTKVSVDEYIVTKGQASRQFEKLEKNYMEYIRSVYPEWKKELEEYEKRRSSKQSKKTIGNLQILNKESSSDARTKL